MSRPANFPLIPLYAGPALWDSVCSDLETVVGTPVFAGV